MACKFDLLYPTLVDFFKLVDKKVPFINYEASRINGQCLGDGPGSQLFLCQILLFEYISS